MPSSGSSPLMTIVVIAALSLLPFLFMTTTSFVKISVVFSILRNALGTGEVPSGAIITTLSAILTLYVMGPIASDIATKSAPAFTTLSRSEKPEESLNALLSIVSVAKEPLRLFLKRNAGSKEVRMFFDLAERSQPHAADGALSRDDFLVLLPAFLITELAEAFKIGFLVFVPFLVIDIVISSVLIALGMQMLSPATIALPFKLLLFVLVDGFYLLSKALVLGYH